MGEPMKQLLRNNPSQVIATYDYFDIAEGTGIKKFTCFTDERENASGAFLMDATTIDYSKTTLSAGVNASGALFFTSFTKDFDLFPFNYPKIIKGKGLITANWFMNYTAGDQKRVSGALIIKLKKVDLNNNEKIIAVVSGAIRDPVLTSPTNSEIFNEIMKIDINQILFKKGEILRFTPEIRIKTYGDGWIAVGKLYHNPATPDTSGALTIRIPFKLDI